LVKSLRNYSPTPAHTFLLATIAVTVILFWRRPDAFYNPQLWAEDGGRLFSYAYFFGLQSLLIPFAGYFHTAARIIAWLGSWLPIAYVPHWYVFTSWLLLIALLGYLCSNRFGYPLHTKLLLGLALVVAPIDNEVFFNLANWAFLTSLFWVLLAISNEPTTGGEAAFDTTLLLLFGLSTPFVVCLWPLFGLRWLVRRTRHSLLLFALCGPIVLIQISNMFARIGAAGTIQWWANGLVDALLLRFGFLFAGEAIYRLPLNDGLRIIGLLLFTALYGALLWHAYRYQRPDMIIVLLAGLLATLLSLYVNRYAPMNMAYAAGRHFLLPAISLVWALLIADLRFWRWLPLGVILCVFLFLTPGNKQQVLVDLDWAERTAACLASGELCNIPINPVTEPPSWYAPLQAK
jgi:hypothetical protein